jgi:RIO kinase 1
MPRLHKEKFKTLHNVFDNFTNRVLFKLISQGHFSGVESPISVGKESNIFSAHKDDDRVIIKIYRLEVCDFGKMYDYIKYDPRYTGLKNKRREVILAWAQREYRNLFKIREIGVRVPKPITFKSNVLVIEFIGDTDPAPKLKDLIPKEKKEFFDKIIDNIKKMYKAGYVHADLSEFNILNHNEIPVFIDFSQCTPLDNPNAMDYLKRDILNICRFFKKHGLKIDVDEVIKKVLK